MRCSICGAFEGPSVLRLKNPLHWRQWWPAPIVYVPDDKKYDYLRKREHSASDFAAKSGVFEQDPKTGRLIPRPVNLNERLQCGWCAGHLKTANPPVCPRCVPKPPPGDPLPCPLCDGEGVLRGAHVVSDVVQRVVALVRTSY